MMTRLTADCVVLGVVLCSRAATCEDPGARTRPDTDYCSTAVLTKVLYFGYFGTVSSRRVSCLLTGVLACWEARSS